MQGYSPFFGKESTDAAYYSAANFIFMTIMHGSLLLVPFFQKVLHLLEQWDTKLFLLINTAWTHPFLDSIFPWWREANTWIPVYLFLAVFAIVNFKQRAFPWILFVVVTFTLTDQLSSTLIKHLVGRVRPCNDAFLMSQVRLLLDNCGAGYSFTSSHATNHFGLAMFIFISLGSVLKKWAWLFLIWAATVSYAQVYVGVHYPLDVFCGALLGCGVGYCTGVFFNRRIGLNLPVAAN